MIFILPLKSLPTTLDVSTKGISRIYWDRLILYRAMAVGRERVNLIQRRIEFFPGDEHSRSEMDEFSLQLLRGVSS